MIKLIISALLLFFNVSHAIDQLPYCCTISAMHYASQYLPENPVIIECGACDGNDSVIMSIIWPASEIHAFEPIPAFFNEIKYKSLYFPNIHPYQLALGDNCGKAQFHVSKLNGVLVGASSLLPPKEHLRLNPTTFDDTIEVNILTLDDWATINGIKHIDYLWLDMQGYELNMLKASEVAKQAKVIYIEVEFMQLYEGQYLYKDILAWMTENNFELVAKDFYDYNLDFGNAVFVKKN